MSGLKRLWIPFARLLNALEGMDDAAGHYMSALAARVDKLEQQLKRLETQQPRGAPAECSGRTSGH